ncbi:MBL fold metallo-hydrolase [Saccharomonospora cyanea]|uniref:Putative Zn-dependent hydrolase of beta-lactamase fold n=1 Tax=Saccharomonospora cyanea NA-134 TaxID=882082 RepID=H5XI68_9PSEU|nr:MBL fold metallo-hydrolase [Saccharomonospora cyanea]EHR60698.1 putative Zn-dependent hydrolase of beta-lactamase fold [Saccharomonospora cyanea NA-134]
MRGTGAVLAASVGLLATAGAAVATSRLLTALGGRPDPDSVGSSPQYRDGTFHNARPARWLPSGSTGDAVREMLLSRKPRKPVGRVPLVAPMAAPADGLHVTWFGHASSLVELDGVRVLLDPVWSDRASPVRFAGPRRLHPVPHRLADLPRLDAIVISHDHYDHLDFATVRELTRLQQAPFVVPLGVGAHLRAWGVPEERVVELDWHQRTSIGALTITATPAQHFSGRAFTRNTTLWASWVLTTPRGRVFYSGDTGYCDAFADIGRDHGPFDLTLVQIGAYASSWPDIHMTPEEGVATHLDVRGGLLVPVHWGTFNLAPHGWADPVERLLKAAEEHDVRVAVPRPGERIDVTDVAADPARSSARHWWRELVPASGNDGRGARSHAE